MARLELREAPHGTGLVGSTRPLGPDPPVWRAAIGPEPHPGPRPPVGVKRSLDPAIERAREHRSRLGVDELLLLDASGGLVEGSLSSIVIVDREGTARTPPASRGGVAGLGLAAARGLGLAIREAPLTCDALERAREIVALNAVRGARPITRLDDRPVGEGSVGSFGSRAAALLSADARTAA